MIFRKNFSVLLFYVLISTLWKLCEFQPLYGGLYGGYGRFGGYGRYGLPPPPFGIGIRPPPPIIRPPLPLIIPTPVVVPRPYPIMRPPLMGPYGYYR
uniref:Uncharacterized protein n=1 Tax=Strongyloides papillosus TaxID=174720 RepID=A0A0N5BMJ8_STREA